MTINEFVYDRLHQLFIELAEKLADVTDDPDTAAAIPFETMRAEHHMRAAWNSFVEAEE